MTRRPADPPHPVPGTHVHDELAARRARRAREKGSRGEPHLRLMEREYGARLTVEELQAAARRIREVPAPRRERPAVDEAPSRTGALSPIGDLPVDGRLSPGEEPSPAEREELDDDALSLQLLVWRRLGPRGFAGFMRDLEEMEAELAKARQDGWGEPG
ncbi:hypothetical protein ACLQ2R_35730 [Streptosporangium sp. DT93]|uniref:hypothetical protein n=1 Tax=Streptosporangium sp. DT93 TaxID=3393428 RepID=UPI003CF87962